MNILYRAIRFMVWLCSKKMTVLGTENLPDEPVVIVGNHSQASGPIVAQLYMPRKSYTWCIAEMMNMKEVPKYSFTDFWSKKPRWMHPFFHMASFVIAPLSAFIMNHADTIAVYRDKRVMKTFNESVEKLTAGADVVIFPECYDEHNNIVHDFNRGFVNVARVYYKKTGKNLPFVPMYISPLLGKVVFGKPVYYDTNGEIKEEPERICVNLMDSISEMAYALPYHKVVPYNNVGRRQYPDNKRM